MLGRPSAFRAALMGSTALTPVNWLYMQAAAEADRVQAATDRTLMVPLDDRIVEMIDILAAEFEDTEMGTPSN